MKVNDEDAGSVLLNTIAPQLTDGSWSGTYFTDYPVTATAVAEKGYRFVGWQCSSPLSPEEAKQESVTLQIPTGGVTLTAMFEKEGSF